MPKLGLVGSFQRSGNLNEAHTLNFKFELGERPVRGGKIFVPLSKEQLRAMALAMPMSVAHDDITLSVFPHDQRIAWFNFFPFGRSGSRPVRAGIGSLVHHAITEYLARHPKYGGYAVTHDRLVTPSREGQLRKMGLESEARYSMQEYRKKVRAFITKKFGALPRLVF